MLRRCREDEATRLRLKYAPYYKTAQSQSGSRMQVDGREMLMLASNDYLGLYDHPKVIEAGQHALREWGGGSCGSRFANGSRAIHQELEERLADFLGLEACQTLSAGYLACMSSVAAFAQRGDVVFVDRNVHSSLWAGITLSGARVERFSHNNPEDLKAALDAETDNQPSMLLIEGIYSMEGHVARIEEFVQLTRERDCFVVVDEAHGLGVIGPQGNGVVAQAGLQNEVDVVCGSFSKSFGAVGGFVAGSRDVIEYFRTNSKQTIFSAAISPAMAACAMAALEIIQSEPERLEKLWANTRRYKELVRSLGLDDWESESPATPIVIGKREPTYQFWKSLWDQGVFTIPALAPGVPPGKDLIRTAVSAKHTDEDFELIEKALRKAAKKQGFRAG